MITRALELGVGSRHHKFDRKKQETDMIDIDIVLVDSFPLLSLTLLTEPLRVANRESRSRSFNCRLLSVDGKVVRSSSGIIITPDAALRPEPADVTLLLAAYNPERQATPELIGWLRSRATRGMLMGSVDTAAYIFAVAGLLSTRPAVAHHEVVATYRAIFKDEFFIDRLVDFSPPRCSSAGGVATIELALALIQHFASRRLAARVAEVLNYEPAGHERERLLFAQDRPVRRVNMKLAKCIDLMVANIQSPIPLQILGKGVGLTPLQMQRLFARYLRRSPSAYYSEIRLITARNMLRSSDLTIGTIAEECGFGSLEALSRAYRRHFGVSPSKDREW